MTRKLMDELRSSGWDLSMPMLDSLGLFDIETVQNMTRSFRGQVRFRTRSAWRSHLHCVASPFEPSD